MSPSKITRAAAAALVGAAAVSAHGHVTGVFTSDGEFHQGWDPSSGMGYGNNFPDVVGWTTTVQDNGFISKESHGNAEMACHRGASAAALSIEVAAGDVLTFQWDTWPVSHHGPVLDYLAPCPSGGCAKAEKGSLSFSKISEVGNITPGTGDNGVWGSDLLINSGNKWQVQIPESVAAGEYVLRHEIIALHSLGEPQHYPQCVNIKVTDGGSSSLQGGVLASEMYSDYEDFNIYQPFESYPIPGPQMIAGASPIIDQGSGVPSPPAEGGEDSGSDNGSGEGEGEGEGSDNGNNNGGEEGGNDTPAPEPTPTEEETVDQPTATVPVPNEGNAEEPEEPAPKPTGGVCKPRRKRSTRSKRSKSKKSKAKRSKKARLEVTY